MGELIAAQGGAIARWQLLGIGITPSRVRSWLRTGRLHHTRFPGIYAAGRADLPELGDLSTGLLFSGHGSALAGISGLWWRGYLERRPELIHVDSPNRSRSRADLRIRHLHTVQRTWHRKLPVTTIPNALLLATDQLSHNSLRLVIARAEFDRKITLSAIEGRADVGSGGARSCARRWLPTFPNSPSARTGSSASTCCSARRTGCRSRSRTSGSGATGPTCSGPNGC
ncbi:MAG: hypothetical protein U0R24_07005 [Solirubrobacterales bacterium]